MQLPTHIFSRYTLSFLFDEVNACYKERTMPRLPNANKKLSIIFTVLNSICIIVMQSFHKTFFPKKDEIFYGIIFFHILLELIGIVCILLSFILSKSFCVAKTVSISLYISFFIEAFFYKEIINKILQINISFFDFIYFLEFLLMCFWHFWKLLEFKESFFPNLFLVALSLLFVLGNKTEELNTIQILVTLITMLVGISMSSYVITRQVKLKFYYYYQLELKNKWYENILDNLASGFIHIKDNKVEFLNKSLLNLAEKYKIVSGLLITEDTCDEEYKKQYGNLIIEKLFSNLNEINESVFQTNEQLIPNNNLSKRTMDNHITSVNTKNLINNIQDTSYHHPQYTCETRVGTNHSVPETERMMYNNNNNNINVNVNVNLNVNCNSNTSRSQRHSHKYYECSCNKCGSYYKQQPLSSVCLNNKSFKLSKMEIYLKKIKQICEKNINSKSFSYIGRGCINLVPNSPDVSILQNINNDNEFIFETLARYEQENGYQIIINDITRTKQFEEKNAEFKYKNLLLTKIAHEFKNPIICIMELAEELKDVQKEENKDNDQDHRYLLSQKMNLISHLSDYLLVLIKDLDYFSLSQLKQSFQISKTIINLKELCVFCTQIANALLIKSQKHKKVKFVLKLQESCYNYKLESDEMKLKQLLINIISNAVKFTNCGVITMQIETVHKEKNETLIRFSIMDTGIGIKESQKRSIFTPFYKSYKGNNNLLGTGLGLPIAQDIANKIGNGLSFQSEFNVGTKFWFEIECEYLNEYTNQGDSLSEDNKIHKQITKKNTLVKLNYKNSLNDLDDLDSINTIELQNISLNLIHNQHFHSFINTQQINTSILPKKYSRKIFTKQSINSNPQYNLIFADDEILPRKANIRILLNAAKKRGINLNIIEVEDGVKIIDTIYNSIYNENKQIHSIISDETMKLMNGDKCAEVLNMLPNLEKKIPFYLVTAYENYTSSAHGITEIFTKPLNDNQSDIILDNMLTIK